MVVGFFVGATTLRGAAFGNDPLYFGLAVFTVAAAAKPTLAISMTTAMPKPISKSNFQRLFPFFI